MLQLKLKTRFQDALSRAAFDERYYRLAHPDVDRAIADGRVESGYTHYRAQGWKERRAVSRSLPGLALPRFVAVFRATSDFLTGVRVVLREDQGAFYRFRLYRWNSRKLEKVADVEFDGPGHFAGGGGYVMWDPVENSKDQRFIARLWRLDEARRIVAPVDFLLRGEHVSSSPRASNATPPLAVMSPVTQCNLNCIHCISRPTRNKVKEITPEIWRTFEDLAARKRLIHVAADYSGDIFYAQGRKTPWLDRLIALDVELRFDTHANNLTPEIADKVLDAKLAGINFSIDSLDPEDYPKIRRGARPLPEVLANIVMFMRKRNARRPNVQTSLSLVLMRRNLSSMIPAIDFAREHKIDFVQTLHVIVFTSDMMEESALLDMAAYREAYEAATKYARAQGVVLHAPKPIEKRAPRKGHEPCTFPWAGVMVTGEGNVNACCMPGSVVGNLHEESLEQIWNGPRLRAFRAQINTPNPPHPCDTCGVYRHENNFESYVPGLSPPEREAFVARVMAQL